MSYLVRCWLTCRVHIATDESSVAAHMEANIMACSIGESSRSYDVGLLTTGLLTGTCPTRYVAAIMSTSITPACVSIDCRQPITGLCSARPRQVRDDGWPSRVGFKHSLGVGARRGARFDGRFDGPRRGPAVGAKFDGFDGGARETEKC